MTKEEAKNYIENVFPVLSAKMQEAIKTLLQEPRAGHWIDDKCSVCGKGIEDLISSREWYRNEGPKFCPFCGVKMEVKE